MDDYQHTTPTCHVILIDDDDRTLISTLTGGLPGAEINNKTDKQYQQ